MCEGLSKISSNFPLHLIAGGNFKRFKKVSSDLKTILKTDLANLRFLSFEKGEACQSILIMLRGKMGLSKPEVKKMGCVWSFLLLEEFEIYLYFLAYLGSSAKTTIILTIKSVWVNRLISKFSSRKCLWHHVHFPPFNWSTKYYTYKIGSRFF